MGEMILTLRVEFENKAAADKAKGGLEAFIADCHAAYGYWQKNRFSADSAAFWDGMKTHHPQAYEFLKFRFDGTPETTARDHNNGLSGILSWADSCSSAIRRIDCQGLIFRYTSEVWHFAETGPICNYLKSHFGAVYARASTKE